MLDLNWGLNFETIRLTDHGEIIAMHAWTAHDADVLNILTNYQYVNYRDYAKEIKRPNELYYDPFTQRIVVLDSTVKVQNLYTMIHNEMARYAIRCVTG